jgi:hypothetical protein
MDRSGRPPCHTVRATRSRRACTSSPCCHSNRWGRTSRRRRICPGGCTPECRCTRRRRRPRCRTSRWPMSGSCWTRRSSRWGTSSRRRRTCPPCTPGSPRRPSKRYRSRRIPGWTPPGIGRSRSSRRSSGPRRSTRRWCTPPPRRTPHTRCRQSRRPSATVRTARHSFRPGRSSRPGTMRSCSRTHPSPGCTPAPGRTQRTPLHPCRTSSPIARRRGHTSNRCSSRPHTTRRRTRTGPSGCTIDRARTGRRSSRGRRKGRWSTSRRRPSCNSQSGTSPARRPRRPVVRPFPRPCPTLRSRRSLRQTQRSRPIPDPSGRPHRGPRRSEETHPAWLRPAAPQHPLRSR